MENDVALQADPGPVQVGQRHQCGHDAAFHIRRAAAEHAAVDDLGPERLFSPPVSRLDGHRVSMAVEDQRASATRAAQDAQHIGAPRVVQAVFQAARLECLEGGQCIVRQDQIMLPVGRILGDVRKLSEHRLDVRLLHRDICADGP